MRSLMLPVLAAAAACGGNAASLSAQEWYNAHVTTPAGPGAGAEGNMALFVRGDSIGFAIDVAGLSAAPTEAHLHLQATGDILARLPVSAGTAPGRAHGSGTIDRASSGASSIDDVIQRVRAGQVSADVHTTASAAAEVSGPMQFSGD
jgi:hypothetical protein